MASSTETIHLGHGLSLVPRVRILLSVARSDLSVKPIDDWQLKQSLKAFVEDALAISIADNDLSVSSVKDLHKCRRGEPVATGCLYLWDVQAIKGGGGEKLQGDAESFLRRKSAIVVGKLTGVELSIAGLKLKCHSHTDDSDDFNSLKVSWRTYQGPVQPDDCIENSVNRPDTLILRGIPARWFAEPRVSSKASVLVTHTILSHFGAIRNLDIKEDDLGSVAHGLDKGIVKAFSCHVWVQFEQYSGFYNAMKAFCGRSMVREGSPFKANYEVSWDKDGYFTEANIRRRKFEKDNFEEMRRRQLIMEARQAEIAHRQAELARLEHEKMEKERLEQLRLEQEKLESERLEQLRLEQEKLERARLEQLRLEHEKLERERLEQLELEQENMRKLHQARLREEEKRKQDSELAIAKEEMRRQKESAHLIEERRLRSGEQKANESKRRSHVPKDESITEYAKERKEKQRSSNIDDTESWQFKYQEAGVQEHRRHGRVEKLDSSESDDIRRKDGKAEATLHRNVGRVKERDYDHHRPGNILRGSHTSEVGRWLLDGDSMSPATAEQYIGNKIEEQFQDMERWVLDGDSILLTQPVEQNNSSASTVKDSVHYGKRLRSIIVDPKSIAVSISSLNQ